MRDNLPARPLVNEYIILNHNTTKEPGSHWTAAKKLGTNVIYFDSFGNLQPPNELIDYYKRGGVTSFKYNYNRYQNFNTVNCGHLCLEFLLNK